MEIASARESVKWRNTERRGSQQAEAVPGKGSGNKPEKGEQLSKILAAAALSGAAMMIGLGTAEAETPAPVTGTVKAFTTAYSSPTDQSSMMYHLNEGAEVDTYCVREGQYIEGNPLWLIVNHEGVSAYVHAYQVSTQVEPPHC